MDKLNTITIAELEALMEALIMWRFTLMDRYQFSDREYDNLYSRHQRCVEVAS